MALPLPVPTGEPMQQAASPSGHNIVRFELRAVETRDREGESTLNDEPFMITVKPGGHQTTIEQQWSELHPEKQAIHQHRYEAFMQGIEAPVDGTRIREWAQATPSWVMVCDNHGVATVEQLAEAPESLIRALGMGAPMWKQRAVSWLSSANRVSEVASENANLAMQLEAQKAELAELRELVRSSGSPSNRKRGAQSAVPKPTDEG